MTFKFYLFCSVFFFLKKKTRFKAHCGKMEVKIKMRRNSDYTHKAAKMNSGTYANVNSPCETSQVMSVSIFHGLLMLAEKCF